VLREVFSGLSFTYYSYGGLWLVFGNGMAALGYHGLGGEEGWEGMGRRNGKWGKAG